MRHLDLFSGIGGFALAAQWAGFETVAFCEKDPFCQKVLKKHWPQVPIYDDIKNLNGLIHRGRIDILTGGFPCQPFSVAGNKKGINDDRYLWPDTMRIIRNCQPTWCVLENVPGIIPFLDAIFEDLEKEAYTWWAYLIPASGIGAPHKRERLWVIAHRDCERFNIGGNNRQERSIQDDWQRHIEKVQSEWPQFVPKSWQAFNAQDWLIGNTNSLSSEQTDSRTQPFPEEWYSRTRHSGFNRKDCSIFNWEEDQPPIPGVDDGIPNGLDRNKALGNAIVPQVAYPILKLIYEIESIKEK